VKLLLDMNVSPAVAERLRATQHYALHWSDVGPVAATDTAIALYAAANGYVIVTHDLDFGALHARSSATSPSVILIRADDLSVPDLSARLLPVVANLAADLAAGALVTIDLDRTRVRILPIHQ
jgi:predicted nuclease of predicted toxin-antitoxin system